MGKEKNKGKTDEMGFLDHLDELRKRIFYAILGVVAGCIITGIKIDFIVNDILLQPILDANKKAIAEKIEQKKLSADSSNTTKDKDSTTSKKIIDNDSLIIADIFKDSLLLKKDTAISILPDSAGNLQDSISAKDSTGPTIIDSVATNEAKALPVDTLEKPREGETISALDSALLARVEALEQKLSTIDNEIDSASLKEPLKIQNLKPMGEVFVYFKLVFITGVILAFPFILYQIWRFIAPGLYKNERKWARQITFYTSFCFFGGVAFSYYVMIPVMLSFAADFGTDAIENIIDISEYLSFLTMLLLAAGLLFELPVVSFVLSKVGILKASFMRKYRKHALVVILLIAAIITPTPDPINQIIFAAPLFVLYEISIYVVKLSEKKKEAS